MTIYCGTIEAAKLLGLSVGTVQSMVEQGELEAWKTQGGHRRISMDAIQRHLRQQATHTNTPQHADGVLRVLVVEDDAATLAIMQAAFDAWKLPLECHFIESAVKALLDIGKIQPDILLTDLHMPGVDGFNLLQVLDSNAAFASTVTLAITALSDEEIDKRGGLPAKVVIFPKPVNMIWLHGFLSAMVAQRQLRFGKDTPSNRVRLTNG
jgi:excisionase family DNA binding protein